MYIILCQYALNFIYTKIRFSKKLSFYILRIGRSRAMSSLFKIEFYGSSGFTGRTKVFVYIAGINPAASAWWTMASHLAAQDYIARLQGAAGLPGFPPGAESLLPPYPASLLNPPSLSSHKSSKCK